MITLSTLVPISNFILLQRKFTFLPDLWLKWTFSNNENKNTYDYIDKIKEKLFENLRSLPHVPSVQMHDRPADGITVKEHKKGHSEGDPETR